jgi:hypothetical protein
VLVFAHSGDYDGAQRLIDESPFAVPPTGDIVPAGHQFWFHAVGIAIALLGRKDDAERIYAATAAVPAQWRYVLFDTVIGHRLAGMVALTAGRLDEAEQHLIEASHIAAEDGNLLDAPHVEYWTAKLLIDRGRVEDRAEAVRLATAAHDEFARRGTPPYLAMADALLERLA